MGSGGIKAFWKKRNQTFTEDAKIARVSRCYFKTRPLGLKIKKVYSGGVGAQPFFESRSIPRRDECDDVMMEPPTCLSHLRPLRVNCLGLKRKVLFRKMSFRPPPPPFFFISFCSCLFFPLRFYLTLSHFASVRCPLVPAPPLFFFFLLNLSLRFSPCTSPKRGTLLASLPRSPSGANSGKKKKKKKKDLIVQLSL